LKEPAVNIRILATAVVALSLSVAVGAQRHSSIQPAVNNASLGQLAAQLAASRARPCQIPGLPGASADPLARWQRALQRLPGELEVGPSPGSRSLPVLMQGVDGTMDQTLNPSFPDGVFLTGGISNLPPGASASLIARGSTGATYSGVVDAQSSYSILLADGDTYSLQVCVAVPNPPSGSSGFGYADPQPVMVSGDTGHDVSLPSATTHSVAGHLLNPDARFLFESINLVAQDGSASGSASVSFVDNSWQTNVPDGTYVVTLTEVMVSGSTFESTSLVIGTVMVSGADVVDDVTVPPTATITGTIAMADGSAPSSGVIIFLDVNAPPPTGGCVAPGLNSAFTSLDSVGNYQVIVPSGVTYSPETIVPVGSDSSSGSLLVRFSPVTPGSPDVVANYTEPPLPGAHMFTGNVTDSSGAGVQGAGIGAATPQITGAGVDAVFANSATSDASGNFSFTILDGAPYSVSAVPPSQ
jgi:hypothetical protein